MQPPGLTTACNLVMLFIMHCFSMLLRTTAQRPLPLLNAASLPHLTTSGPTTSATESPHCAARMPAAAPPAAS